MNPNEKEKSSWLDFGKTFIITIVVALLFINFIAHPIRVVGSSMYPTLEDGEYGFTNILGTKTGKIQRNEIVIVTMHEDGKESQWVKRIIGLPNETIECINDEIYINGTKIDESEYIDPEYRQEMIDQYGYFNQYPKSVNINGTQRNQISDWGPVQLKENEYFVMGDNRPCSSDSRNPAVGPVQKEQIYGKSILVLLPLSKMGWN